MSVTLSGAGRLVTLPDPDFEDSWTIEHLRINQESRAGTRIIFRDPSWPRTEVIDFKFSNLSQYLAWDVLAFIQATLGIQFWLMDHFGQSWYGIILNPEAEATQNESNLRGDNCGGFTIELKFEGTVMSTIKTKDNSKCVI